MAPWRERFRAALRDDLNAPRALAVTFDVLRSELPPAERRAVLLAFDETLALGLCTEAPRAEAVASDPRIDALVADRQAARKRRDFAEADRIRDVLAAENVVLEDTPDGPRWRRG
jgi:cysteinyl-tRNA synthetase